MKKHVNLDIVRIFAAWMVLSVHIAPLAGMDFSVGARGVQLFFVLSGYLAFASLEKNSAIIPYYKKRLIRILPTYWTCLVIIYIKDAIITIQNSSIHEVFAGQCGPQYMRYFLFLQCFIPSDDWNYWNNHSALWTMSSFALFYLVAPFLYRVMRKFYQSIVILIVFLFGTPYFTLWIENVFSGYPEEAHIEWFASMNPFAELYCFLLGTVLFVAIREHKQNIYLLIVVLAMAATALSWYPYELLSVVIVAVAVLLAPLTQNNKVCRIISWISGGSFTLYLIHYMILDVIRRTENDILAFSTVGRILYLYVMCFSVSYILYYLVIVRIEKAVNMILEKQRRKPCA